MSELKLISIQEFCNSHEIEPSFILMLSDYQLIEIKIIDNAHFVNEEQLSSLERIVRLHRDLDINLEGIDVILNLLNKMSELKEEINRLQVCVNKYEN